MEGTCLLALTNELTKRMDTRVSMYSMYLSCCRHCGRRRERDTVGTLVISMSCMYGTVVCFVVK